MKLIEETKCIEQKQIFTVSKTDNIFVEVIFTYPQGRTWEGCFPIFYPPSSIQFDINDIEQHLSDAYKQMTPESFEANITKIKKMWLKPTTSETYKVFQALLTGQWECRSCGAGKINDQPAARIRDIKKNGFVIATQNRHCTICNQKQYHDILLVFDIKMETKTEFRKPISPSIKEKIISVLSSKDVFFDATRPHNEFVIDHKFPSQRWTEPDTDNINLTNNDIKNKFQLLTNQSNMLKSRLCDYCCKSGIRPSFLGIKWFYYGNENWVANNNIGSGCYGCPWFDLEEWKRKLNDEVKK
jgi:hypothetical protein